MTRWTNLGGYPVEQHTSPNRGGEMDAHRGVVCHVAEGTYRGTISWQMNPDQRYGDGTSVNTCSTWIVGKNVGEIAQMVDTDEIAWCQRAGSRTWLSIEFAGYHTEALTAWQIEAAALILAAVHAHYGVPLQVAPDPSVRGLGHHSMDRESLGEEWGHEDCPGPKIIAQKPQIVARAIAIAGGDDMLKDESLKLPIAEGNTQATTDAASAVAWSLVRGAATLAAAKRIEAVGAAQTAALARIEAAEAAQTAAIKALAETGGTDAAPILAAVAAVREELGSQIGSLRTQVATLQADLDAAQGREAELQRQLAQAHTAAAAE